MARKKHSQPSSIPRPTPAPVDINGDGKIDQRERLAAKLGAETLGSYDIDQDGCINRAGVAKKYLKMFEHDPNEIIIAEIVKHPIGLVLIWFTTFISIIGIWVIVGLVGANKNTLGTGNLTGDNLSTAAIAIGLSVSVIAFLFGYVSAFLYVNNRIIVTSEKLVQIRYFTLFNSKVSSLSIGDVQDVTARQTGILATIFNFGKISVETAGEQDNYEFPLAINAREYSKIIVQAHEENLHKYGN